MQFYICLQLGTVKSGNHFACSAGSCDIAILTGEQVTRQLTIRIHAYCKNTAADRFNLMKKD